MKDFFKGLLLSAIIIGTAAAVDPIFNLGEALSFSFYMSMFNGTPVFWYIFAAYLALAYLVGSIPFGMVLTRLAGYGDIRKIGSGNIGATNVLRTGNKWLAALTVLLDAGKVGLFITLMEYFFRHTTDGVRLYIGLFIGLFGIIGHCFPVWLHFKGGKGVATTLGTLLAAVPITGVWTVALWLLVGFTTRYSSLAAIVSIMSAPFVTYYFYGKFAAYLVFVISAIVFIRHYENLHRLRLGTESKIGAKKKEESASDGDTKPAEISAK